MVEYPWAKIFALQKLSNGGHQNPSERIREPMNPYEKHKNYKFKAFRDEIKKSATVKDPLF